MLEELLIAGFATAAGFVAAGIISSFYQLVTANPARFDMADERMSRGLFQILLLMFAGPAILMRNAIRGRLIEGRPIGWLFASTAIAGAWSLCSGVIVLEFAMAIRDTLV